MTVNGSGIGYIQDMQHLCSHHFGFKAMSAQWEKQLMRRTKTAKFSAGQSSCFFPRFTLGQLSCKHQENYFWLKGRSTTSPVLGGNQIRTAHHVNPCLVSGLAKGGCNGRSGFALNSFKRICRSVNFSCSCAPYFLFWPSENTANK